MKLVSIGECMVELSAVEGDTLWRRGFAGDTLNTAWYARALLPQDWSVDYLTAVGCDPLSGKMVAFLQEAGIGTGLIQRHPTRAPGLYTIELQDGERTFTYWRDTSAAKTLADDPARLAAALVDADIIYFSGITIAILPPTARDAFLDRLDRLREAGTRIVFDPNLRSRLWPSRAEMCAATTEAATRADIVLPSHDDEATHFGDSCPRATAERYRALGAAEVVVKNGGADMVLADAQGITPLSGLERVRPVDTTAAGDSFNGGYLAARLMGASAVDAARKGHETAMKVVLHRGALMPIDQLRAR